MKKSLHKPKNKAKRIAKGQKRDVKIKRKTTKI
jgi:hypothetical protein